VVWPVAVVEGRNRGKNCPKPLDVEISTIVLSRASPMGDVRNFRWSLLFDLFCCDIEHDGPNCLKLSCIIHSFLLYDVSIQQN